MGQVVAPSEIHDEPEEAEESSDNQSEEDDGIDSA